MKFSNSAIILIFAALLSLPLFFMGIKGHDAVNHLIISRLFSEQFLQGDYYPRWLFNAENGFGSPALYYFPPLAYYITLLFYPLHYLDTAFTLPQGYLALYSSATLAILLSGIFSYKWLQLKTDNRTALLATLLYIALPYHLVDLYFRFAFSELWAFAFMPLCLYLFEKKSFIGVGFAVALLTLSHPLTAMIFLPTLIAFIIFKKQPQLLAAIILGIGASAFYLLPAIMETDWVSSQLGLGIYDIRHNFIKLSEPVYFLSVLPILFIIPFGIKRNDKENIFWISIALLSLFMTVSISSFIWNLFPVLFNLSFPWRFLIISSLAATALSIKLPKNILYALIVFSILLSSPALIAKNAENPDNYLKNNLLTIDDFRPKGVSQSLVVQNDKKTANKLENFKFPDVTLQFHGNKISVTAKKAGVITIPQFYFPNFTSPYNIEQQPDTDFMQVTLQEPKHFTISRVNSFIEKLGFKISILSLLLLILGFSLIRYKNTKVKNEN